MNEIIMPLIKKLFLYTFLIYFAYFIFMCLSDTEADLRHHTCQDGSRASIRRNVFSIVYTPFIIYGEFKYHIIYFGNKSELEYHHEDCIFNYTPQFKD